ncbi:MAG: mannose-6-phosphate isomerase, class I [Spirochaetales bacterium]|jgi:mannose-6-phosphate isomerase|nr:mannose-6-phosphate isomerase, class I [Spirochaetales bacterium]
MDLARPLFLDNSLKKYPWGSGRGLSEILGNPSLGEGPQAEYWMGAHPSSPSRTAEGPLDRLTRERPEVILGPGVSGGFPFLFKVLSIAAPLSLQVHPGAEQARRGFDRENSLGLSPGDPRRCYADPYEKPELFLALRKARVLAGFRPPGEIRRDLARLRDLEPARRLEESLAGGDSSLSRRAFMAALYRLNSGEVLELCRGLALSLGPEGALLDRLSQGYPGDPGSLAPLFLNFLTLNPGEALFLAPGVPHAYLEGEALELMGNSDNVLRGGLTSKLLNPPEFLEALDYAAEAPPRIFPQEGAEQSYPLGQTGLALTRWDLGREERRWRKPRGPEILLCLGGRGRVQGGDRERGFSRGDSFLIPGGLGAYELVGEETLPNPGGSGGGESCRCWIAGPADSVEPANPKPRPRLWVDGDSCPREVRELILRGARRRKLDCVIVANRRLPLPPEAGGTLKVVPPEDQAADDEIARRVKPGDLAVTRDLGLAGRLLAAGAVALNDRGQKFQPAEVESRLAFREFLSGPLPPPERPRLGAYGARQLKEFAAAFDRELGKIPGNET